MIDPKNFGTKVFVVVSLVVFLVSVIVVTSKLANIRNYRSVCRCVHFSPWHASIFLGPL